MTLPYDPQEGYGVIVARLAKKGESSNATCPRCDRGLKATEMELAAAQQHELQIMDQHCAEAYVLEGEA